MMINRKKLRLENFDYSQDGSYFITLCTQNRKHYFGQVTNGNMHLNDAGSMIHTLWNEYMNNIETIHSHKFIVMPNHLHGIISIVGASENFRVSLSELISVFKSKSTNEYINGVKNYNWESFDKKLWQPNYYEHVIRDENALERIHEYIDSNPARWNLDKENPGRSGIDSFDTWLESFNKKATTRVATTNK